MGTARELHPTLENGAVMTREEFHHAYQRCEGVRRAELVEGVVFMPSPVRFTKHDRQAALIRGWLFSYSLLHPGLETGGEASLLLGSSELQPDAFLMRSEGMKLDGDGYLLSAPDLVVEIAASSKSRDLHSKFRVYLANGVQEYIVWRVLDESIDWFRRSGDEFVGASLPKDGIFASDRFPGLRLSVALALANDAAGVIAELR